MPVITSQAKKIKEVLTRGVDKIVPQGALEKQMLSGKKLRIYFGIDPTGAALHLGHAVVLRKMKAFQDLGHKVILLIGDFTAKIGDPTDKLATRQPLTDKQVKENMRTYQKQASKILDFSKIEIAFNSSWLKRLSFDKVAELAAHFSVQRMMERDMFEKRLKEGKNISLLEFLYPLMQGWDSVMLDVDLELSGSDQLFNALAGRKLQKIYNNKEKSVLTFKLLSGTDGQKMSKSLGNFIALNEKPNEMFGKIMSLKDELIREYFELCSDLPIEEIEKIIIANENPKEQKIILAKNLVAMYHSAQLADKAEAYFKKVFQKRELPEEMPVFKASKKEYNILDLLFQSGIAESKSDAKRLVQSGAVKINQQAKNDWREIIVIKQGDVLQAGKRKFVSLLFNQN